MTDARSMAAGGQEAVGAPVCAHCGLPVPRSRLVGGDDATQSLFCCFGCRIAREVAAVGDEDAEASPAAGGLFVRLGMGVFLTLNLMVFRWLFYAPQVYGEAANPGELSALTSLLSYLMMFLTAGVMALLWAPLAGDAVMNARAPRWGGGWRLPMLDMNTLIVVGTLAAFVLSVVHTIQGASEVYYETAAMILVLVTLGGYLDASVKKRAAGATMDLLASIPQRVHVRSAEGGEEVIEMEVADLAAGQLVRVAPGEAAACDGEVVEGSAWIDESSLTGESRPRSVARGDRVLAGSVSADGLLWIRALRVGADRTIDQVRQLLEEARMRQPGIQRLADRVAGVFIPLVLAIAVGVFLFHAWEGQAVRGLMDGLCVLLISCPCALGLAAPLATWSALARAARQGLAIDSGATLERAARVSHVFFDKTGTLTEPVMALEAVHVDGSSGEAEALAMAGALEESSPHPIARAIVAEARRRGLAWSQAVSVRIVPGAGIEASVAGRRFRLGGERLIGEGVDVGGNWPAAASAVTRIYLVEDARVIACFDLTEQVRDDAAGCIEVLRAMGIEMAILTGDQAGPAARLAKHLGIAARAGLLPADKLAAVEAARGEAKVRAVAMIGDGVNDAPVLAAADVGVAVAGGTDLAHQAGNVRIFAGGLDRAAMLFAIARHAMGRIRLNLLWAFGYNTLGLTLAVAGYLTPVFSALAMFGSSVMIILTSKHAGDVVISTAGGERSSDGAAAAGAPNTPVVAAGLTR